MTTPERPNLAPYIDANDYLWNSTAQIWDEMDTILNQGRKKDMRKLKKLEEDFQTFNQAFDALVHDSNPSPVIRLLENQAEDLRAHSAGDENTKIIQELKRLATDLSRAA